MKFLFFLVIVLGTLAVFNPKPEAFQAYAEEQAANGITDLARSAGGRLFGSRGERLGEELGRRGGPVAEAFGLGVREAAHRDNYFLFSLYTIDLDGPNRDAEEFKFLGIAGQFIPLKKPASLERLGA